MKKLIFSCLIATLLFTGCGDKEEKLPADNPETVEATEPIIVENNNEATDEAVQLQEENKESKEKITELEGELSTKDKEIEDLKTELNELAEKLDAEKNNKASSSNVSSTFNYVVSGSFSNMTNAKKQIETLKKAGFDSYAVNSGKYVRVISGSFKNKANAQKQKQALEKAGFDAFIISAN